MTRFFVRPEQLQDSLATLEEDDTYHLRVVLHAKAGDAVTVLDGTGRAFPGRLESVGKTQAMVRVGEAVLPQTEPATRITVAQALPKMAEKMEQVLQHGTEIGASSFWAYAGERGLTHLTGERQTKRLARWSGIIKTAAEQSHRALLPSLRVDGILSDVLASAPDYDLALLAHPEQSIPLRTMLAATTPLSVLVIIGPESGFSTAEIAAARRAGVPNVSLGPRVLRTETAALTLVSQLLYGLETDNNVR
jgi:16S rRNA (uracil1498-N3)-methyltransferase